MGVTMRRFLQFGRWEEEVGSSGSTDAWRWSGWRYRSADRFLSEDLEIQRQQLRHKVLPIVETICGYDGLIESVVSIAKSIDPGVAERLVLCSE